MPRSKTGLRKYAFPAYLLPQDIQQIRKRMEMTQREFAAFAGVSVKTVERWESSDGKITGAIVPLICILTQQIGLKEYYEIPEKAFPIRMGYMFRRQLCTLIDVNPAQKLVAIKNYTSNPQFCAFGNKEVVSFQDYEDFLEARCFPRERDKMKLMLREYNIPFYDPMLIVRKTQGRTEEDDFWISFDV